VIPEDRCVFLGCGVVGGDVPGVTTGNRPDSPCGLIVAPGMGAKFGTGGSGGTGVDIGVCPTTVVIVATAGDSDDPLTLIVRVIGSPATAVVRTRSLIISLNAWLAGRMPIVQVVLCAAGQSVNRGDRITCALDAALAVTWVARTVLQTQIE